MESRHKQPNQTILKVFSFFKEFFCSTYSTTTIPGNRKNTVLKPIFRSDKKWWALHMKKRLLMQEWIENEGRKIGLISVFSHIKSEALLRCMSIYRCNYWNDERVYIIRFRLDIWPRDWRVISLTMKRHECLW